MLTSLARIEKLLVAENELPWYCRELLMPGRVEFHPVSLAMAAHQLVFELATYPEAMFVRLVLDGQSVIWRRRFPYAPAPAPSPA
jgi:hypothetical protein